MKISETTSEPGDVGVVQQDMQLAKLTEEEPPEDVEELVSQEISELEGLGVRNYKHKPLIEECVRGAMTDDGREKVRACCLAKASQNLSFKCSQIRLDQILSIYKKI